MQNHETGNRRHFNPRSPCGERRRFSYYHDRTFRFQSTLPMRGATKYPQAHAYLIAISIHAPHAGSDSLMVCNSSPKNDFNPRSPCGERRHCLIAIVILPLFQSTLPMRGATKMQKLINGDCLISIHAPHAGSDTGRARMTADRRVISIHAPHAGSDLALKNVRFKL